jgi:hypothetical protein
MLKEVSVGDGIDAWPSLSGESYASSILPIVQQGNGNTKRCYVLASG